MASALIKGSHGDHLINALIPLTVALHLSKESRELGLLALFIWIVLQLLSRIIALVQNGAGRETWLSWCLLLGLMLLNVRNVVLRDDYRGPVIVLLIGVGLLLGSQFNQRQWTALLAWLAFSVVPIGLFFAIQLGPPGAWLAPAGDCYGHRDSSALFCTYYETVQSSMGSINRLATLSTFLTLAAWYRAGISRALWVRGSFLLIAALGYWISIGTGSRMAILAIPSAIALPWLLLRLGQRLKRRQWLLTALAAVAVSAVLAWEWVVKRDTISNTERLRMASCWVRRGFLSNVEHFFMGRGFDTSSLREACQHVRPDQSFGHAHNTLAQIAGNHGLLGLIALGALCALIVHGLWTQSQTLTHALAWSPWTSTTWFEISLGLNLALLICALATTVQEFSPVNQLMIGLVAGAACINPASRHERESAVFRS